MASTGSTTAQQIADLQERQRSASRARSQTRDKLEKTHSKTPSNASETIVEEQGEEAVKTGGRISDVRGAVGEGNAGPVTATEGGGGGSEAESSSEEEDGEEEEAKAPVSVPKPTPVRTERNTGKAPDRRPQAQSAPRGNRNQPDQTPQQRPAGQTGELNQIQKNQNALLVHNLSPEHRKLMEELCEINGQDSYDALAAGVGKLKTDEYLLLPNGLNLQNVEPADVGKPVAHQRLRVQDWANIYALNKTRAPDGADAKVFALLRLEAVKCGWYETQREISYAPILPGSIQTLAADMADLRERAPAIKTASFLLPLVAEHVFRTFGHHFISTDATNYVERYVATFRSCLAPEIAGLLPPSVMYHTALHWVSPGRAWRVLKAQLNETQIPDALKIRVTATPAGTAILTTTHAILESMSAVGLDKLFAKHGKFDVKLIHDQTVLVQGNPPRYHKAYFAYGIAPPTADQLSELEKAKAEGVRFAPFAQAYINTYMKDAALGRAQALKKHAEQNPVQMRRAANLFRALSRGKVTSVEELFAAGIGNKSPTVGTESDDE